MRLVLAVISEDLFVDFNVHVHVHTVVCIYAIYCLIKLLISNLRGVLMLTAMEMYCRNHIHTLVGQQVYKSLNCPQPYVNLSQPMWSVKCLSPKPTIKESMCVNTTVK